LGPAGAVLAEGEEGVAEKARGKTPDLKENKEKADEKKDVLEKQDLDKDLKLQIARSGTAPSGKLAPKRRPFGTGGEASEGRDVVQAGFYQRSQQLFAEDPAGRDGQSAFRSSDYLSEPFAEQTAMPQKSCWPRTTR
jgi:hypothetical protein